MKKIGTVLVVVIFTGIVYGGIAEALVNLPARNLIVKCNELKKQSEEFSENGFFWISPEDKSDCDGVDINIDASTKDPYEKNI